MYKDKETEKAYYKRTRAMLKAENRCVRCRKPLEEHRLGKCLCEKCNEKVVKDKNEQREFYKSIGICPRCCKNTIVGDEKSCLECKIYHASYQAKKKAENREAVNEYNRNWSRQNRLRLIEEGICVDCKTKNADEGFKTCSICRAKRRVKATERRAQKESVKERRIREGKCVWCENPKFEDFKVCENHYQIQIQKMSNSKADAARKKFKKQYNFNNLIFAKRSVGNGKVE